MGQIQPKEEAPDAPDSLVRRLPTEVHGGKRHIGMQVNSLTRLDVVRRREIERKEEMEKKKQKLLMKGQGQILGLLDDDWMFPGPTLEPLLGDVFHPPSAQELEDREVRRRRESEDARERKWKMENAEQIKKEMQESISKRLKALPPKSQSKASSQPEPEPEHEEEEVEEAQPEESTEKNEEEEEEEEEVIPQRPPVPMDDEMPGFGGITFLDPSTVPSAQDAPGVGSTGGKEDLPPVPSRRSRTKQ